MDHFYARTSGAAGIEADELDELRERTVPRGRFRPANSWGPKGATALVSVVIPTLNEADNLRCVVPGLPRRYELIVVDGGSTDGTVQVARTLRPDAVVMRQTGRGKGDALLCGFQAATGEVIVTFDGDGSARADEIPHFVDALQDADFAKGSRFVEGGGSADLTRLRRFGNLFLCGLVNLLYGTAYTDLCYGYTAFRRSCLPFMPDGVSGFEIETMINIRMARARMRIVEVPSYEDERQFGQSNLNTFRDGLKILRVLIRERFRSRPSQPAEVLAPTPEPAELLSIPVPAEGASVPVQAELAVSEAAE
jgi:glycosyltransferase involved in cell wall biosynthesis